MNVLNSILELIVGFHVMWENNKIISQPCRKLCGKFYSLYFSENARFNTSLSYVVRIIFCKSEPITTNEHKEWMVGR